MNLILGDCIEIMKNITDNSVDLIVTSPPYNIGIDYDSCNDNLEWNKYYDWCRIWLNECKRVLKDDGKLCLNHYLSLGNKDSKNYPLMKLNSIAVEELSYKHHALAIWYDTTLHKRTAWGSWLSASSPYISSPLEGILILYKDKWKKNNKGKSTISKKDFMMACSGIWKISTNKSKLTKAEFPVRLPKLCIELLSYEGDSVLDLFMGSGTTGIACIQTKRNFIGIEISKNYFDIAKNRIIEASCKLF